MSCSPSIEAWRMRSIKGEHLYMYLDGCAERIWAGGSCND